jgi:hypothetical protein
MQGDGGATLLEFLARATWAGIVTTDFLGRRAAAARVGVGEPFRKLFPKRVIEPLGARDHAGDQLLPLLRRNGLLERAKLGIVGVFVSEGPYRDEGSAPLLVVRDLRPRVEA